MSTDAFVFPTSFAQRRLWFVHQLEPRSPSYNVTTALGLSGNLDRGALEHSLFHVIGRHEALRTSFRLVDGEPVQVIAPELEMQLPIVDRSEVPLVDRDTEVRRLVEIQASLPFDLERGPLLRAQLVRLAPDEHVLILVVHHIVFDGWSSGVLSRELSECYRAFTSGNTPQLPDLPIQYADFAVWQREWLASGAFEQQLAYWRAQLAGAPAVLDLPTDFHRPALQGRRGATEKLLLPLWLLERLRVLGQEEGATLFMTLLAGFQLLLSRYTGQKDIVIGSPIANRPRSELEQLVGFFVNSLALRTDLSASSTFRELLRQVRSVALGAYANQDLPFEGIVEELNPERIGDRNPFFQVMFALQNAPRSRPVLSAVTLRSLPTKTSTAKFDLTLHVHQLSRGLMASLEYNTDLFEVGTVKRMLCHLQRLLEEVTSNPDRPLSSVSLLDADEEHQVLHQWNGTARPFPADRCVHEIFESQAASKPDNVALEDGSERMSYGELNRRANRLARYLQGRGVGPEVSVGVAMERSPDLVVAMLAVLKAGGAYVPLDTGYPAERVAAMLVDARVRVVITSEGRVTDLPDGVRVVALEREKDEIAAEHDDDLGMSTWANQLAYVMHTSGSTGAPKGIGVPHQAIVRLVLNTDYVQLTPDDRVAQVSNPSFDGATFEIWGALLNGARLVLLQQDIVLSPVEFGTELRQRGITAMFLTTALFNLLAGVDPSVFETVHHLLFGGEVPDPSRVREVVAQGAHHRLLHVYGPTEVTTFATWLEVREVPESAQTVPIGRPIANTTAYVLDQNMMPVAIGLPGELYLGGPGVARGYFGRPSLTAERFVPDPFGSGQGDRLYRTGDRVRLRSDGNLEFLGRLDSQIKLRGFRIEPGEIETVMARHPDVRECAVVLRDDLPGGRGLVGYLAPKSGNGRNGRARELVPDVRSYLQTRLPAYMLPSAFVVLEALPLSPNGKIARGALPRPDSDKADTRATGTLPATSTEMAIAKVWQELLEIDRVNLDDNFFELGGHSLLAVKLFAEIQKSFSQTLPVSTLFQAPTVRGLADILSRAASGPTGSGLVVLQSGRQGPPLFVVHEVDGQLMLYRELVARLGADLPIYGFELAPDSETAPVLTTFEELAAKYVQQMRVKQPMGPYFLCGYCWAGELTFEMARQLVAAGQEVAFLGLIDSRCRNVGTRPYHRRLASSARKWWKLFTQNVRRLAALERAAIPAFLQERAENITMRLVGVKAYRWSLQLGHPVLPLLRQPSRALEQAARCYQPSPYPGSVTLFKAQVPGSPASAGGTLGWARVAMGGVEVHQVPGEHMTIIHEPQVQELARQLRACLDRARATSS
jgi:amino acid adenylation domain-containing protein